MKQKKMTAAFLLAMLAGCARTQVPQGPDLPAGEFTSMKVHRDEQFDLETRDQKLIGQFLDAIGQIQVEEEYTGTGMRTDSMEYVIFVREDGTEERITFDMGRLDKDGRLYNISGTKAFDDAMREADRMAMEEQ